jgi:L-lactate dehydrogenase complex protein LldG
VSEARAEILERLRAARRTARLPEPAAAMPVPAAPAEDPLGRFRRELDGLGVQSHLEETPEGVRARVAGLVGARQVLAWDADQLPYDLGPLLPGASRGTSPRAEQAAAEVGVTGCEAAIAETGSLVMVSAPGRPRVASLLPPLHVAVVRRADLFATMGEFFAAQEARLAASAACTFITGPSRTADIELVLTLGVHGPGQVVVVIGP